jgi:hypothetical protein
MCTEHMRIGQVLYELKQNLYVVQQFKTDSVLYRPLKRTRPRLANLTFRDLDTLRDLHEQALKMRRLNQHCLMTTIPADEAVYTIQVATESDPLKCDPSLPQRI